jgi:DNA-binding IclR family transcriptional regulator
MHPAQPIDLAGPAGPEESASSVAKAVDVLTLFGADTPALRIEHITSRLGYTRSTAYRYVRELCAAGLLASRPEGRYSLGPRIVELERLLRVTDPLYQAGCAILPPLRSDDCVYLLQELSREDQVLCIYKEGPDELRHGGRAFVLNRERGLPFPLFRGAGSLALLAHLPPERIQRAYLSSAEQIAGAGLGTSWPEFRTAMAAIRRRGWALVRRADAPHVVGIAVPVLVGAERRVIGSLDYVIVLADLDEAAERDLAARLDGVAVAIAAEYERISQNSGMP